MCVYAYGGGIDGGWSRQRGQRRRRTEAEGEFGRRVRSRARVGKGDVHPVPPDLSQPCRAPYPSAVFRQPSPRQNEKSEDSRGGEPATTTTTTMPANPHLQTLPASSRRTATRRFISLPPSPRLPTLPKHLSKTPFLKFQLIQKYSGAIRRDEPTNLQELG